MEISESQHKAAGEIVDLIALSFGQKRAIHPATAISAGARLSGTMLFRSFDFTLPKAEPGSVILSEEANNKGPMLINVLGWSIESNGGKIDKDKLSDAQREESKVSFLDTLNKIQNQALKIKEVYGLSFEDFSYSCAMATAFIVTQCKNEISIESGFNTAMYGFIEGCKTMPPNSGNNVKKTSWFRFGRQ